MKVTMKSIFAAGLVAAMAAGCQSVAMEPACTCKPDSVVCGCKDAAACKCTDCTCRGAEGRWAIQRDGAFWLGIFKDADGKASAQLLWGGGSPNPQFDVKIDGDTATMKQGWGKDRVRVTTLKATGAEAEISCQVVDKDGKAQGAPEVMKAKRIPALPPAPDVSKAVYGAPIDLLADGMEGWKSMNEKAPFGWSIKDGVLSNRIRRKPDGTPYHGDANIVTKRADFFDFKLSYDVRVLPGCNSGVYLRGIYEIQVLDSYGKPVDCHHMAALYGRITPSVAAEKPANEWQHVDVTLYKRHVTVVLNGTKIIDNAPVLGCTGGAITSDEFVKGPLYLQGDHSDADFRNMILTPIEK